MRRALRARQGCEIDEERQSDAVGLQETDFALSSGAILSTIRTTRSTLLKAKIVSYSARSRARLEMSLQTNYYMETDIVMDCR